MINLSYIRLQGKIIDNYTKTLKGYQNKMVNWVDVAKPMSSSNIQYSCYRWRNGVKTGVNLQRDKQDCIILDIDNGMSIPKFQKMFSKYSYIVGTTKNHQKTKKNVVCDRFRVVLKAINIPEDDEVYFRTLELLAPFNDRQTETKTASFLGNDDAIIIYNEGKTLDLHKIGLVATEQINQEQLEREAKKIDKDLLSNSYGMSIEDIKARLNREVVVDILESIGIEFNSMGKCKLRPEENTSSAKVYPSGYIKDYGDGELSGDIFNVLMGLEGMSFIQALRYVKNYI